MRMLDLYMWDQFSSPIEWDRNGCLLRNRATLLKGFAETLAPCADLRLERDGVIDDVRTIDIVCGGFPYQPFNVASKHEARKMTATSGRKCLALSRNSDPTLLELLDWHSTMYMLTWKGKATPAGRLLFQLVPSERHTDGIRSGLWATPQARDYRSGDHLGSKSAERKRKYLNKFIRLAIEKR